MSQQAPRTPFHDHQHAQDFHQRAGKSDVHRQLGTRLIEALDLTRGEWVLDIATGTGRFARPVASGLGEGRLVGVDQALAMLQVGRESVQKEPLPIYCQVAGDAGALPIRDAKFHRAFISFTLHHFSQTSVKIREAWRILRAGGKLVILDPVIYKARDALDESLIDFIHGVFQRSHEERFGFHNLEQIGSLLQEVGFRISRADTHAFSFDQEGADGIPMGPHWIKIAEELQEKPEEMRKRFEEVFFRLEKENGKVHVRGSLSYAVVCGEKP